MFRFSPGFVFFFLELHIVWDMAQIGPYVCHSNLSVLVLVQGVASAGGGTCSSCDCSGSGQRSLFHLLTLWTTTQGPATFLPRIIESWVGSQCWLITSTLHHLETFPLSRAKSKANYCIRADVSLGARVHKLCKVHKVRLLSHLVQGDLPDVFFPPLSVHFEKEPPPPAHQQGLS